jgi:V/A-type H+-transporting ATPase subunit A
VKAFLGLRAERPCKRCFPAVDNLLSWSRCFEQLQGWFARHVAPDWVERVQAMTDLLHRGDAVNQMIQVAGEEGISLDDFITYQQAQFLDLVCDLINRFYHFADKDAARDFFVRLTGLFRNLNDAPEASPTYTAYRQQIEDLASGQQGRQSVPKEGPASHV